jgi:nucleotide-binding universal stress UspA family protein
MAEEEGVMMQQETHSSPAASGHGPVMLALSTFRQSEQAVDMALEKAKIVGRLVVVHVADVNLARYLIGSDIGLYPELQQRCENELLTKHEREGREKTAAIAERARAAGLAVSTHVTVGRFAIVCLQIVAQEKPSLIVTTRSKRPEWVRRFFGSPVNELIAKAGCPVIEA